MLLHSAILLLWLAITRDIDRPYAYVSQGRATKRHAPVPGFVHLSRFSAALASAWLLGTVRAQQNHCTSSATSSSWTWHAMLPDTTPMVQYIAVLHKKASSSRHLCLCHCSTISSAAAAQPICMACSPNHQMAYRATQLWSPRHGGDHWLAFACCWSWRNCLPGAWNCSDQISTS